MRTRMLRGVCALLGLLLLAPPLAYGGKVYKWVIDGKTVYMDKKPPSDKGKVEEKRIDDERNVIHMTPADTEVSSDSKTTGPQRSTQTTKNKKLAPAQNQTGKNVAGSTGTATTGKKPIVRTTPNVRTSPNFTRGRSGATAGPGATPGPGI